MDFLDKISTYQMDVLKEVGNIGAGHAATALSQLLNKVIDMNVPSVRVVSFNEIMDLVGGAENVVASVYFRILGDAPGGMYFMLPLEQASTLLKHITGDESVNLENPPYSEFALSALQEVGNILSGSYLSSFSDFTRLNLCPSVPAVSIDMAGAILSFGLIELSQYADYAIVIDTSFSEMAEKGKRQITGHFFLLPDPGSFKIIFNALGVSTDE